MIFKRQKLLKMIQLAFVACCIIFFVGKIEVNAACAHTGSATVTKSATCTSAGSGVVKCTKCKKQISTYSILALGHNYSVITKYATCGANGTKKCSRCPATTTISATGNHSPATSEVAATCVAAGSRKTYCTVCNTTLSSAVIPVKNHNLATRIVKATCTSSGATITYCTSCNTTYSTAVNAALGHDFTITKYATCSQDGSKKCSRCPYEEKIAATQNHVADTEKPRVTAATCTKEGKKETLCKSCSMVMGTQILEKTPHNYKVTKAAICATAGTEKCTECVATRNIAATGNHNYEVTKAATCTTVGTEKCTECVVTQEIPATGKHNYITTKAATCGSAGTKKCSMCSATVSILATGEHSYVTTTKQATCSMSGYQRTYCSTCGYTSRNIILFIRPHNYIITISSVTCGTSGLKKCAWCTAMRYTPATGNHVADTANPRITPATCTEKGKEETYCKYCDLLMGTKPIALKGHDYIRAYCTEDLKCSSCGSVAVSSRELGHNIKTEISDCMKGGFKACTNYGCTYIELIPEQGSHNLVGATCSTNAICTVCGFEVENSALGHLYTNEEKTCCSREGCVLEHTPYVYDPFNALTWPQPYLNDTMLHYVNCSKCTEYLLRPHSYSFYYIGAGSHEYRCACQSNGRSEKCSVEEGGDICSDCGATISHICVVGKKYIALYDPYAGHRVFCSDDRCRGLQESHNWGIGVGNVKNVQDIVNGIMCMGCGMPYKGGHESLDSALREIGQSDAYGINAQELALELIEKGYIGTMVQQQDSEGKCDINTYHIADSGNPRITPSTCTEEGKVETMCKYCGLVIDTQFLEKKEHIEDIEKTKIVASTCTENGKKEAICTYCDQPMEPEIIPLKGHEYTRTYCTEDLKCSECGSVAVSSRELGHNLKTYISDCGECGYKACTNCECKYIEVLPEIGNHEWVEATCETNAMCKVCGFEVKNSAMGHLYTNEAKTCCTRDGCELRHIAREFDSQNPYTAALSYDDYEHYACCSRCGIWFLTEHEYFYLNLENGTHRYKCTCLANFWDEQCVPEEGTNICAKCGSLVEHVCFGQKTYEEYKLWMEVYGHFMSCSDENCPKYLVSHNFDIVLDSINTRDDILNAIKCVDCGADYWGENDDVVAMAVEMSKYFPTGGTDPDGWIDMMEGNILNNCINKIIQITGYLPPDIQRIVDEMGAIDDILPSDRIAYYLEYGINNVDSAITILGEIGSYDVIGIEQGYTYFQMSADLWLQLESETMENQDEMWKVKKQFIDEQIEAGNRIFLSNDPYQTYDYNDTRCFYQRELDYLKSLGYTFKSIGDNLWEAVK